MHGTSVSQRGIGVISRLALAGSLVASIFFTEVATAGPVGPDLVVLNITFSPSVAYTNDDVRAQVQVKNIGSASSGSMTVDVYVDRTPVGCSDWGDYFADNYGLDPNGEATLYMTFRDGDFSAGSHNIYAFVDSGCSVTEANETNNISTGYALNVTAAPAAPVHDDIAAAKTISNIPSADSYVDVLGATRGTGDPQVGAPCYLNPGRASVWYEGTPGGDTSVKLDTMGSNYDTWIAVWTGSPGSLTLVDCNDDLSLDVTQSMLRLDLTGGTHYYLEVAQYAVWYGQARPPAPTAATDVEAKAIPAPDVNEQAGGMLVFHITQDVRLDDFDADGPTDIGYFHPATGLWSLLHSGDSFSYGTPQYFSWGQSGDIVVPGDYDGDKLWDPAVRTPPAGGQSAAYRILLSSLAYDYGSSLTVPAGWPGLGDTPVVGDYNGDGKSDPAIWRGSAGVWIIPLSPTYGSYLFKSWGTTGDTPVSADVDGDGRSDIGYWRPSTGVWGFLQSSQSYSYASPLFFNWGQTGDIPVMADYDGDGFADPAVVIPPAGGQSRAYRILLSSTSFNPAQSVTIPAGWPGLGDTPVPADYDGDGKADAGIWRNNSGVWIIPKSSTGNTAYIFAAWGAPGDQVIR